MDHRRQRAAHGQEVAVPVAPAYGPISLSQRRPTFTRFGCGVAFFIALVFAACGEAPTDSRLATHRSLTVGLPESTVTGPRTGFGEFVNVLSLEGLIYVGADGRAVPWLASEWNWENNYRRLRVHLRPNVVLHDGRPLNAELTAELLRQAIPNSDELYPALNDIASVRADGNDTLVLELSRVSGQLPEDLSVLLRTGEGGSVGTGPYKVVSRDPKQLIVEGFDRYYLGPPFISRVEVKPIATLRTSWRGMLRGEVDVVSDVPADAAAFIQTEDVQIASFARWYQFQIAFNSQRGALRSPLVRRALNLAVDREGLIKKVLQGAGQPSTGPIWPQYWAYDSSIQPYTFDPTQAAALLDAAGYPLPRESDASGPPARLRFVCLLPDQFSVWERIALEVQKNLFDIGVDVQFKAVPVDEFLRRLGAGDFEAVLNDMIGGPTPGRALIFWRSARAFKGQVNVFGYENTEAERLYDAFRASTNEAAMRSATSKLQQAMLTDPPALFLAWNTRARAISSDFALPEAGRDPLLTVSRWTVRTPAQMAAGR